MKQGYQYSIIDYLKEKAESPQHEPETNTEQLRQNVKDLLKLCKSWERKYKQTLKQLVEVQTQNEQLLKEQDIQSFANAEAPETSTLAEIVARIEKLDSYREQIEDEIKRLEVRKYKEFGKSQDSYLDYDYIHYPLINSKGKESIARLYIIQDGIRVALFDIPLYAETLSEYNLEKVPEHLRHDANAIFQQVKEEEEKNRKEDERIQNEQFTRAFSDFEKALKYYSGTSIFDKMPENHKKQIIHTLVKEFHPDNVKDVDPEVIKSVLEIKQCMGI